MKSFALAACLLTGTTTSVLAQEPVATPVPSQISALAGCWQGAGSVMGKPVLISLKAKPITEGALFLVEAESSATADPADRYAAHLIFGGKAAGSGDGASGIFGFFADSFGGDFTAVGAGSAHANGFEVAYDYSDATFVNQWVVTPTSASWTIVAKDATGAEEPFATYDLTRLDCGES